MRSPISRRPIADQSPTSFNDSHAPILTKLVGDRSATSRRLIGDWSATSPGPVCDQISRSQVFVQAQKPGCDWFGRNEVPDQSPTSLQPRRDRSGTLLRPLRSVKIVSRGEVAERLQCMSDWGFYSSRFVICPPVICRHKGLTGMWPSGKWDVQGGIKTNMIVAFYMIFTSSYFSLS